MYEQRLTDKLWRDRNNVRVFRVVSIDTQRNDLRVQQVDGLGERTETIHSTDATAYHKGDLLDISVYSRGGNVTAFQLHGITPQEFAPVESEEAGGASEEAEESEEATDESGKPHRGRPRKAS